MKSVIGGFIFLVVGLHVAVYGTLATLRLIEILTGIDLIIPSGRLF